MAGVSETHLGFRFRALPPTQQAHNRPRTFEYIFSLCRLSFTLLSACNAPTTPRTFSADASNARICVTVRPELRR